MHGYVWVLVCWLGRAIEDTINVTIKFQQLFAVDENSCCCSSCRTWAWSGSTCEGNRSRIGTARGNLRCSSGQPPCSTETALGLAYRSRPAGAKPDRSLPTPRRSISSPSHDPQRSRASGREMFCPRTRAISWRWQRERNPGIGPSFLKQCHSPLALRQCSLSVSALDVSSIGTRVYTNTLFGRDLVYRHHRLGCCSSLPASIPEYH